LITAVLVNVAYERGKRLEAIFGNLTSRKKV